MRYAKGVLITLLTKGIAIPLGIVSSVITARYLGPEGRGVLAVLIVLQGVAVLIGNLGLQSATTYFISGRKEQAAVIASNVFSAALVLSLALVVGFYIIGAINPSVLIGEVDVHYLYIFLLAIPCTLLPQLFQGVFLAFQKIYELNVLELLPRFFQVVLFSLVLILMGGGTTEAAWCFVGVTLVVGVIYVLRVQLVLPLRFQLNLSLLNEMLRYGIKNTITSILLFLVVRINLMLVNQQLGTSEAGVYSIVLQIYDVVYLFPSTLALLLFSKVSGNVHDTGHFTAKVLRFSTAAMVCLGASILLFGRPVIEFMFGFSFVGSVAPLYWLIPGLITGALGTIILNDLGGRGLPLIVPIAAAVALLINLAIVVPSTKSYGLVAPAVATSIANVVLLVIVSVYFGKRIKVGIKELFVLKLSDLKSLTFRDNE